MGNQVEIQNLVDTIGNFNLFRVVLHFFPAYPNKVMVDILLESGFISGIGSIPQFFIVHVDGE